MRAKILACLQKTVCLLTGLLLFTSAQGFGQAPTAAGRVELVGFGGISGGFPSVVEPLATGLMMGGLNSFTVHGQRGTKPLGGCGLGIALSRDFLITGEFLYNQFAGADVTVPVPRSTPVKVGVHSNIMNVMGGFQYQIPVKSSRVVPYLAGAVGLAHERFSADVPAGGIGNFSTSNNDFTQDFGGGVRFYVSKRWGFRPEFKGVHIPDATFYRVSGGIFYQFGGQ